MPVFTPLSFVVLLVVFFSLASLADLSTCLSDNRRSTGSLIVDVESTQALVGMGHHHCRPRFVHLSPTGSDSSVRLTWQTSKEGCSSTIRYRRSNWIDSFRSPWLSCTIFPCKATGKSTSFDAQSNCYSTRDSNELQWRSQIILYTHTVILDKLAPDRVEYQYVFDSGGVEPGVAGTFRSPPKNKADSTLEFVAFGDMGSPTADKCPGARGTIDTLIEDSIKDTDVILHNGDISYADGSPEIWQDFQREIEPISSAVPYVITVGNHDYGWLPDIAKKKKHHAQVFDASGLSSPYLPEWGNFAGDSKGECGYPLINRFVMPQSIHSTVDSRAPFWYSFQMGPAQFIILSGEHDVSVGSEQRWWLDSEFATIDRSKTPWVIVMIHRPLYVAFPHKSNRIVGEHLREMLEDEFIKHNVSLVVSGHVHSYYRTCPVLHGKCKKHGIVYLTIGSAGKQISDLDEKENQPEWIEHAQPIHGFGRFLIRNSSALSFEYVESQSGEGRVIDRITIQNRHK
jgi:predicted phosphohydrolase